MKKQTLAEINRKLAQGKAVILTAMEFKDEIRGGQRFRPGDVDVVTTATRGIMSGTAAMFVVPVAGRGEFTKAKEIYLNGVPGTPGPAPNERLGVVDTFVYGTAHSKDDPHRYGGGHLFRDLVAGQPIEVECLSEEGKTFEKTITLKDLEFARMYGFRNAFENYNAFSNLKNKKDQLETIFHFRPMIREKGLTVSGCGELNPIQNDPQLKSIGAGSKILVNKAFGVVVGFGTRSSKKKRNLSFSADMFDMDPEFMGGFKTNAGPECIVSVAVPIPILDQDALDGVTQCLDERISLAFADISDRIPLGEITYADIWTGTDLEIEFQSERCVYCSFSCVAEYYCPMKAISWKEKRLDKALCFGCGACTVNCLGGAFQGNLGKARVLDRDLPVVFRQSDRRRAMELAEYLKKFMREGNFSFTENPLVMTHHG